MSAAYLLVNERASGLPSFPDLWSSWSAASCGTSACESTVVCQAGACGAQIKWSGNQTSHLLSSSDKQITSAFSNRKREATTAACCPALLHLAPDFTKSFFLPCYVLKSSSKTPAHISLRTTILYLDDYNSTKAIVIR